MPMNIYDNISLISSENDKYIRHFGRENHNTRFMFNNFISENGAVYEIMLKNTAEQGRPQMKI